MPLSTKLPLLIVAMWFTIMGVAPFAWPDHALTTFTSALDWTLHLAGGFGVWKIARA